MSYNGAFKNYRSQLNGWAVAQALDASKSGVIEVLGLPNLLEYAKELGDYAYVAEQDLGDITDRFAKILTLLEDPISAAEDLINELQFFIEQHNAKYPKLADATVGSA